MTCAGEVVVVVVVVFFFFGKGWSSLVVSKKGKKALAVSWRDEAPPQPHAFACHWPMRGGLQKLTHRSAVI
jgi:hypothetical protein